jgi:hypothetical protein
LAQAAHELLAWTRYVSETGIYDERAFDAMNAGDKIRLNLADAGIPISLPIELPGIGATATQMAWADGPQVLTEIRNKLVHPSPRNNTRLSTVSQMVRDEAVRLSLWYLEMLILNLMNYNGVYASRLPARRDTGTVQDVPWK